MFYFGKEMHANNEFTTFETVDHFYLSNGWLNVAF
jgi:hypothetical protein